jgi:hypothetical protein
MELNPLLSRALELGASDIHLKVGVPPILRRDGVLRPLDEYAILTDKDMESLIEVVGTRSPERLEAFKHTGDLDIAFQESDLPRFGVNALARVPRHPERHPGLRNARSAAGPPEARGWPPSGQVFSVVPNSRDVVIGFNPGGA